MSTPIINEERLNKAIEIPGDARRIALQAEREALRAWQGVSEPAALYDFELYLTPAGRDREPTPAQAAFALPLVLPPGVQSVTLADVDGRRQPASLTDVQPLPAGRRHATVRFAAALAPQEHLRLQVFPDGEHPKPGDLAVKAPASQGTTPEVPLRRLHNRWLEVEFSEQNGVEALNFEGVALGGSGFLAPFISYGSLQSPHVFRPEGYRLASLATESWEGLSARPVAYYHSDGHTGGGVLQ